jgi:hypothetical protein
MWKQGNTQHFRKKRSPKTSVFGVEQAVEVTAEIGCQQNVLQRLAVSRMCYRDRLSAECVTEIGCQQMCYRDGTLEE